jgi:hypothetical protein
MAPRENDAQEAVVDRSTTPNTLAEKAEKDTQKRLRNKARVLMRLGSGMARIDGVIVGVI